MRLHPIVFAIAAVWTSHIAAMDLVRPETRADLAVSTFNVDGTGVTVAILDRGIDWSHPDFINANGTTRIKAMLDMSGFNLCSAGNLAPVEYSEAQINAALSGGRIQLANHDPDLPFCERPLSGSRMLAHTSALSWCCTFKLGNSRRPLL